MIRPKRSYRHNQPTVRAARKFRNVLLDRIGIAQIERSAPSQSVPPPGLRQIGRFRRR
jgi:hypothetical protein